MIARGLALMWEEWRRTRGAVICILLVLSGLSMLTWSLDERKNAWPLVALSGYAIFGLIIYLLFAQSTRASIDASIPPRRYRLPVSSFDLALWPFLYRLSVISVGAILVTVLYRLTQADSAIFSPVFIFWLILSALHTLAFASPLLGRFLPGVLGFLMLFPGVAVFARAYDSPSWRYPQYDLAGMAVAAGLTLVLTTAAIAKTRTGGFGFAGLRRKTADPAPATGAVVKRPFSSAAGAQRWFEWRCIGRNVVLLMAGLTLAFLLSEGCSTALDAQARYKIDPELALIILLTNSAAAGLWAFANQSARIRRSYSAFVQTRPVSNLRLALAKFETAIIVILVNLAIVAVVLVAVSVVVGAVKYKQDWAKVFEGDWEWRHLLLLPAAFCLAWILYWRGVIVAGALIGVAVCSEAAPGFFARWVYSDPAVRPVALAFMAASVVVLSIPLLRAWRREVFSAIALAGVAVAWVAGTALASALLLRYAYPDFDTWSAVILNALLVLLALTPFARVPLRIAGARHE